MSTEVCICGTAWTFPFPLQLSLCLGMRPLTFDAGLIRTVKRHLTKATPFSDGCYNTYEAYLIQLPRPKAAQHNVGDEPATLLACRWLQELQKGIKGSSHYASGGLVLLLAPAHHPPSPFHYSTPSIHDDPSIYPATSLRPQRIVSGPQHIALYSGMYY